MVWINLPDDVCSAPILTWFRKKLKSYLFKKAFPPWHINYPVSPGHRRGYVYGIIIIELVSGVAP